jgi:hypothetical protein
MNEMCDLVSVQPSAQVISLLPVSDRPALPDVGGVGVKRRTDLGHCPIPGDRVRHFGGYYKRPRLLGDSGTARSSTPLGAGSSHNFPFHSLRRSARN